MKTFAQAEPRRRSRAAARPTGESGARAVARLASGRPASATQATLAATLNHGPRVQSQSQLDHALNHGPRAITQAKFSEALSRPPGDSRPAAGSRGAAAAGEEIARAAAGGPSQSLPHEQTLRQSFGPYFPTQARARVGAEASTVNRRLGTGAITYGGSVLFGSGRPPLGQAAHEAAHLVQQQHGLASYANTGKMEAQARAVARRVTRGESAAPLFDRIAPRASRGTARPAAQADTGLLRPADTGVEYVRIDVDGDGSCLFYSVLLGQVAARMLAELEQEDFAGMTPGEVAEQVYTRAAKVLNVEREQLREGLRAYQHAERQAIAHFWRQNIDDARVRALLRGDIRRLIITFLERTGLKAGGGEESFLPPELIADFDDRPSPVFDEDEQQEGGSFSEDETGQESKSPLRSESERQREDEEDLPQQEYQDEYQDETSNSPVPWQVIPDSPLLDVDETDEQRDFESQERDTGGVAEEQADLFTDPEGFSEGQEDYFEESEDIMDAPVSQLMVRLEETPLGQGARPGGRLEIGIREAVIEMIANRAQDAELVGGGVDLTFTGDEFGDSILNGLLGAYIEEFANEKLYAGAAALDALNERSELGVQTHIYSDSRTRIKGEEGEDQTVNVLETPNHFQVLVGPFVEGIIRDPDDEAGSQYDSEDWGYGTQEEEEIEVPQLDADEAFAAEFNVERLAKNPLGVTSVGIGVRRDDRTASVYVEAGERKQPLVPWIKRYMARRGPLGDQLEELLEYVETFVEGRPYRLDTGVKEDVFSPMSELIAVRQRIEGFAAPESLPEDVYEVNAGLSDAEYLFAQDGVIYTQSIVPLLSLLDAILAGPLSTGKTHAGAALLYRVRTIVADAQEAIGQDEAEPEHVEKALSLVARGLHVIAQKLMVNSLKRATVVEPMPRLPFPFRVFLPSPGKVGSALRSRKNAKVKYDDVGEYSEKNFIREAQRQTAIQQKYLNLMTLDQWMQNRDLFNLKVAERRENIMGRRSAGYLQSLVDTMLLRNVEVAEKMGTRGPLKAKKARLREVNENLKGEIEAEDAIGYLMGRRQHVRELSKGRRYDPREVVDEQEVKSLLLEILDSLYETGKLNENDENVTAMIASDLVGRANPQSKWKKTNWRELVREIEKMLPNWRGLRPRVPQDPLRGLAVLHNPDQVAGGEREIPLGVEDITEFIGPNLVNTALGGTWGLPEKGETTTRSRQLEEVLLRRFPEEGWPLYRMNINLQLEVTAGSRETPGQKGGGKRKGSF